MHCWSLTLLVRGSFTGPYLPALSPPHSVLQLHQVWPPFKTSLSPVWKMVMHVFAKAPTGRLLSYIPLARQNYSLTQLNTGPLPFPQTFWLLPLNWSLHLWLSVSSPALSPITVPSDKHTGHIIMLLIWMNTHRKGKTWSIVDWLIAFPPNLSFIFRYSWSFTLCVSRKSRSSKYY